MDVQKLLIANRGEIAVRIARSCRKLGITPYGLYSENCPDAYYLNFMHESFHLGSNILQDTWLSSERITSIAREKGMDAVHPGYGFLSEQAGFASACKEAGILFMGPPAEAIAKMGDKSKARSIARSLGIPVIPGYDTPAEQKEQLIEAAQKLGYPILLKAALGGGGKGMHPVHEPGDLLRLWEKARNESGAAFGDRRIILEKLFTRVRHIEVQIASDSRGQSVHFFERDCSLQRRHQKIFEEAPAPGLEEDLRESMCHAAVKLAKAVSYEGVGTVEFIVDCQKGQPANFYFLEMNTRIQVEHPVTEQITGVDLVSLQMRLHQGHPLPMSQKDIKVKGHAVECRLYAEDPDNNFIPSAGTVTCWKPQKDNPSIRLDSGITNGEFISVEYDPLLAKIIAGGQNRHDCLAALKNFLGGSILWGLKTNLAFLHHVVSRELNNPAPIYTGDIGRFQKTAKMDASEFCSEVPALAAILPVLLTRSGKLRLPGILSGYSNTLTVTQRHRILIAGQEYLVSFREEEPEKWQCIIQQDALAPATFNLYLRVAPETTEKKYGTCRSSTAGVQKNWHWYRENPAADSGTQDIWLRRGATTFHCQISDPFRSRKQELLQQKGSYQAPLTARVSRLWKETGHTVTDGEALIALEAMKMEHVIYAETSGTVKSVHCNPGQLVEAGSLLLTLD